MKLSSLLIIFCISRFFLHSSLAEATFPDAETAEDLSNQFQEGFFHRKLIPQSMQTSVRDNTNNNSDDDVDDDDDQVQRKVLHEVHSGPNPIGNSFPKQKMKRPRLR
ncbi:hypothetical protein NL676_027090 [Syzygium grande]|nr:hypothetical protein NL676_027090 [Syzygium grande]